MFLRSVILAGAAQGFFLILLLSSKKESARPDKILMLWLAIIAFQLLFYYDNLSAGPLLPATMQAMGFSLPLLSSPVIYFYVCSLAYGSKSLSKNRAFHILPFLLFNLCAIYLNLSTKGGIGFSNGVPHFSPATPAAVQFLFAAPMAVVPACYIVLSLIVLIRYQRLLPQNYSSTEQITLNWLKWIVLSLLVLFIILFPIIKFAVSCNWLTYKNLFAVIGSLIALYLFFIGYFGLRQTTLFTNIPTPVQLVNNTAPGYKNSGLNDQSATLLFQKLEQHMQQSQPFLNEDLNLATLASELNITPNQLSQVINQKSSSNFFNYVNGYRVQAVKQRLKDPAFAHYAILAIAYDCGFRSKSVFNKIFKEMENITPSQYQRSE
jgi:AraC-like DNA-binding protein